MPTEQCLTPRQLMAVYRKTWQPSQWLSDIIARGMIKSSKKRIEFDHEETDFGLAPYVRPCDEGVATAGPGHFTKWFRPAYIKMKDAINVCDDCPSWYAGEREYTSLTPQQKFDLERTRILQRHGMMLEVRREWSVAKLAVDGSYNIAFQGSSGNVLMNVNMSYGRSAELTVVPATTWDIGTSRPARDLQTWLNTLTRVSKGVPFLCVMGRDIHPALVAHEDWNDKNHAGSSIRSNNFDITQPSYKPYNGAYRVGAQGGIEYFTYTGTYRKADGTEELYIPANKLIIVAADQRVPIMTRFYGAIQDLRALRAMEMFQKEWAENDPSVIQILTQSAPLIGTLNPNLILTATVLP